MPTDREDESRNQETVLLVDDEDSVLCSLASLLKLYGFNVLTASDGPTAVLKAKTEKPDLIVLDIMMPDVGGPEVRIELMKDLATKSIPLIFLTGLRPPRSKPGMSAGVRVIGKSGDFQELLNAIRETLEKNVRQEKD